MNCLGHPGPERKLRGRGQCPPEHPLKRSICVHRVHDSISCNSYKADNPSTEARINCDLPTLGATDKTTLRGVTSVCLTQWRWEQKQLVTIQKHA